MSGQTQSEDPGCLWRGQPEEEIPVNLKEIMNRRAGDLFRSTRSEILTSIAATVVLIGILAWRLQLAHDGFLAFGLAAAILWIAISLYSFRRRIWGQGRSRPDVFAVSGLEYYRDELQRRRRHLNNEWLWHGPVALAVLILIAVVTGKANMAFQPVRNIVPLLLVLAAWIAFGIWRRRLQAKQIQREIEEVVRLASGEESEG